MNELRVLWLPLSLAGLAVLVLLADVLAPPRKDDPPPTLGWLVAAGLGALLVATFFVNGEGSAAAGAYEGGAWTTFLQRLFLAAGTLGTLGAIDDVKKRTARRQGEYWLTLLFSLIGMMIVPGARSLVLVLVSFELMSVPLYVLAAYAKTDSAKAPSDG